MVTRERSLDKDDPIIQSALEVARILCNYYSNSTMPVNDAYISSIIAGVIVGTGIAKLDDTPDMQIIAHNLHNAEKATEFCLDMMAKHADLIESFKKAFIKKGK